MNEERKNSGRLREFGIAFIALAIAYWLFVGSLSEDEISLALVGAAAIALWSGGVSRAAPIRFRFEWQAVRALTVAVAGVPRAAARIAWALIRAGRRRPRGGFVEQPFRHGREDDTAAATRRAMTLLAISLAPDRFVLVHDGDRLRIHRIGEAASGGDEEWPA